MHAENPTTTIGVALIEDDEKTVSDLTRIFSKSSGSQLVQTYRTAEDALAAFPHDQARVVLVDINLPGMCGIECTKQLLARNPGLMVLMLTVSEDTERLFKALRAGALGYLLKRESEETILENVRLVAEGGAPMSPSIARKVVQHFHPRADKRPNSAAAAQLTPRELEIVEQVAAGYSAKESAQRLKISVETVRTHLKRVYRKLQVGSGAAAVAKIYRE